MKIKCTKAMVPKKENEAVVLSEAIRANEAILYSEAVGTNIAILTSDETGTKETRQGGAIYMNLAVVTSETQEAKKGTCEQ